MMVLLEALTAYVDCIIKIVPMIMKFPTERLWAVVLVWRNGSASHSYARFVRRMEL